ncbi:MAG: ABC transporter ATP-binding protein [Microbacteriaceae bacterium]
MDSEPERPSPERRGSKGGSKSARSGSPGKKPGTSAGKKPSTSSRTPSAGSANRSSTKPPARPPVKSATETDENVSDVAENEQQSSAATSGPSFRLNFSPISKPSLGRFSEARHPTVAEVAEEAAAEVETDEPETDDTEGEELDVVEEELAATDDVDDVDDLDDMRVEPGAKPVLDEEPEEDEPESEPEPEPELEAEDGEDDAEEPEPEHEKATAATAGRWTTAASRAPTVTVRTTPKALSTDVALSVRNLTKRFGRVTAVDSADLEIKTGSFYGFVGPNGAGKTTTLAMITGLLRPDSGVVKVYGADVWRNASVAKRSLGVLPDHLRLFDRLTGAEYLHHAAGLRGLDRDTTLRRTADLVNAFGLEHSLHRFVSDYSAGMVKKIAIAAAMIHSPRLLVLDEPFESVDPVSAQQVIDILQKFTQAGGTVLMSSHSMHLIQRICDSVAIIADGRMLAQGTLEEVLGEQTLEDRFVELAGGASAVEGMEWLHSYSD